MRIAGLQRCSFVDYPGKLSAVVFTPGCNMDCFYCHNRQLLTDGAPPEQDSDQVLAFFARRTGMLDAVVISGGEPTLRPDLPDFAAALRDMGFLIKLDTNGTHPEVIRDLLSRGLLDFVAMDVKAPLARYEEITRRRVDLDAVAESIDLLLSGEVDYEFRTTVAPQLDVSDLAAIAMRIRGANSYVLQQYRPQEGAEADGYAQPHPDTYLANAARAVAPLVSRCSVRGTHLAAAPVETPAEAQTGVLEAVAAAG
jgi:pyruvate formate lyase activating enzyme